MYVVVLIGELGVGRPVKVVKCAALMIVTWRRDPRL
jgi:hypothetical protein